MRGCATSRGRDGGGSHSGWTGCGAGALPDRALPGSASRSRRGVRDRAAWGVAPSRVAGRPAWRYPACRTRLSISVNSASQRSRHRGKTIAAMRVRMSAQASDCPLQPTERALRVRAGVAASARVHRRGMWLRAWPKGTARAVRTACRWPAFARSPLPKTGTIARSWPDPTALGVGAGATGGVSPELEHLPTIRGNQDTAPSRIKRRMEKKGLCGGQEGLARCQVASFKPFSFVVRIGV